MIVIVEGKTGSSEDLFIFLQIFTEKYSAKGFSEILSMIIPKIHSLINKFHDLIKKGLKFKMIVSFIMGLNYVLSIRLLNNNFSMIN